MCSWPLSHGRARRPRALAAGYPASSGIVGFCPPLARAWDTGTQGAGASAAPTEPRGKGFSCLDQSRAETMAQGRGGGRPAASETPRPVYDLPLMPKETQEVPPHDPRPPHMTLAHSPSVQDPRPLGWHLPRHLQDSLLPPSRGRPGTGAEGEAVPATVPTELFQRHSLSTYCVHTLAGGGAAWEEGKHKGQSPALDGGELGGGAALRSDQSGAGLVEEGMTTHGTGSRAVGRSWRSETGVLA